MSGKVIPINAGANVRFMLVAVEPSGDALGAALFRELKKLFPAALFTGCGGPLMEKEGFRSLFPIDPFSVIGFTDVARAIPAAYKRAEELTQIAITNKITAAVFVDGWAFSRICAKRMRKQAPETKLFKFGAPQVWGSRPQRVHFVKAHFDGVLCLLPFEPQWFRKVGVKAEFVGNPNFQAAWAARGDRAAFRERHGLGQAPVLAVLPGSRRGEIERLRKPLEGAVSLLAERVEGLRIVAPLAPQVEQRARAMMAEWPGAPVIVDQEEKYDAFAAADAAIAKSGTVTTEIAINRTPMVITYRFDPLTAFWARRVLTTPFASVLNYAAGRYVIPELIQEQCTAENLAGAVLPLLTGGESRIEQLAAVPELLAGMAVDGPPAERLAAEQIRAWMAG
ncbi:MAG: lipid-A-disaccharide synthase [Pseudomonadota bacterium]|nr:lipid-A-disaccharide synthase [Pseudomonadota bacterium]